MCPVSQSLIATFVAMHLPSMFTGAIYRMALGVIVGVWHTQAVIYEF